MVHERVEHVFRRDHVAADQQFGLAHRWLLRRRSNSPAARGGFHVSGVSRPCPAGVRAASSISRGTEGRTAAEGSRKTTFFFFPDETPGITTTTKRHGRLRDARARERVSERVERERERVESGGRCCRAVCAARVCDSRTATLHGRVATTTTTTATADRDHGAIIDDVRRRRTEARVGGTCATARGLAATMRERARARESARPLRAAFHAARASLSGRRPPAGA